MRVQQRGEITCCLGTAVTWYMRGSFAKVLQHKTLIFLIPTLITEYLLIIDNFNVEIQAFFFVYVVMQGSRLFECVRVLYNWRRHFLLLSAYVLFS